MAPQTPAAAAKRPGSVGLAALIGGVAGASLAGHRGRRAGTIGAFTGAAELGLGHPRLF
jgi:hypothetical protein